MNEVQCSACGELNRVPSGAQRFRCNGCGWWRSSTPRGQRHDGGSATKPRGRPAPGPKSEAEGVPSRGSAAVVTAGGLLIALGSFLPWIAVSAPLVGTVNRSGLEGGDGMVTLLLGVATILIGASRYASFDLPSWMQSSGLITAGVSGLVIGMNYPDLARRVEEVGSTGEGLAIASIGIGFWTIAVGVAVALAGSYSLWGEDESSTAPERSPSTGPCEHAVPAGARYCTTCGADASTSFRTCANGHPIDLDHQFCSTCGAAARERESLPERGTDVQCPACEAVNVVAPGAQWFRCVACPKYVRLSRCQRTALDVWIPSDDLRPATYACPECGRRHALPAAVDPAATQVDDLAKWHAASGSEKAATVWAWLRGRSSQPESEFPERRSPDVAAATPEAPRTAEEGPKRRLKYSVIWWMQIGPLVLVGLVAVGALLVRDTPSGVADSSPPATEYVAPPPPPERYLAIRNGDLTAEGEFGTILDRMQETDCYELPREGIAEVIVGSWDPNSELGSSDFSSASLLEWARVLAKNCR